MTSDQQAHPGIGRAEFALFVAAIMAVNALGVDLMLPALHAIGEDLGAPNANARQWIVTAFIFGFAIGQLIYGPLADRYGRKPVLLVTLAAFVGASLFAAEAASFGAMIGARVLQGIASASTRVLAVAIVRDSYSGRRMARIMSVAQMIFFIVPILAPTLGQGLLQFGPWPIIFHGLAAFAALVLIWSALRLPETLPVERRRPISVASVLDGYKQTLSNRYSAGYAVAGALTFAGVIGFVASAEQLFVDTFHQGERFPILFALCAFAMGCASFANSRLVERLGTRMISQIGIFALIAVAVLHIAIAKAGIETITTFVLLQAVTMTCIGLCGPNFGAMAMAPVGHIAGSASSVQGFITSIGAFVVGSIIGQAYDGTSYPLAIGYLGIGLGALAIVWVVEGGQLFKARLAAE